MKLFLALAALLATSQAFQIGTAAPRAVAPAVTRTVAPLALVSDKYDAEKAWIRVPGNKWVDLKELTPLYLLLGCVFFVHDYALFQLNLLPGEAFMLGK